MTTKPFGVQNMPAKKCKLELTKGKFVHTFVSSMHRGSNTFWKENFANKGVSQPHGHPRSSFVLNGGGLAATKTTTTAATTKGDSCRLLRFPPQAEIQKSTRQPKKVSTGLPRIFPVGSHQTDRKQSSASLMILSRRFGLQQIHFWDWKQTRDADINHQGITGYEVDPS